MHVHRTMYLERTGILFIVFLLLIWQVNQVLVPSTTDDDLADLRIRMAYILYVRTYDDSSILYSTSWVHVAD